MMMTFTASRISMQLAGKRGGMNGVNVNCWMTAMNGLSSLQLTAI
jgi:hypothetical protein